MTSPRPERETPGTPPGRLSALSRTDALIGLLLFLLVIGVFLPALRNGFTNYDDNVYVTENIHVRTGVSAANITEAFRGTEESGNWHPLTWLSHMLDAQLFGLRPWGHHLTSILLHALNAALLFLVLKRMTGAAGRSLFVAAAFGLHPLHVESVAWIAERKDVLSALFWMLTVAAYVEYVQRSRTIVQSATPAERDRGRWFYYTLALIFFAFGLLSKPMVVTLPFVLLILDYWPLGRIGCWRTGLADAAGCRQLETDSFARMALEKVPFFALAALASVVTAVVQTHAGGVVVHLPFGVRAANAAVSYVRYLGKMFWPTDLASLYPLGPAWPVATVVATAALLVAVTAASLALRRRQPWLLVGWFWFLGTLVPVIGLFIQVGAQAIADRYTYIPSVGIFIMLAWGAVAVFARWRPPQFVLPSAAAASLLACIVVTERQIPFWKDSESLACRAIAVTENNFIAHNNLGAALDHQGRLDDALAEYRKAVDIKPGYLLGESNLGSALKRKGRYDEAIRAYRIFLLIQPASARVHYQLGTVFEEKGDLTAAIAEYETALRLHPEYPEALNNQAGILGKQGRIDEAIAGLQKVIVLRPDYPEARNNLGSALAMKGRYEEAAAQFRTALKLNPGYTAAQDNLNAALQELSASTNRPAVIHPN